MVRLSSCWVRVRCPRLAWPFVPLSGAWWLVRGCPSLWGVLRGRTALLFPVCRWPGVLLGCVCSLWAVPLGLASPPRLCRCRCSRLLCRLGRRCRGGPVGLRRCPCLVVCLPGPLPVSLPRPSSWPSRSWGRLPRGVRCGPCAWPLLPVSRVSRFPSFLPLACLRWVVGRGSARPFLACRVGVGWGPGYPLQPYTEANHENHISKIP